MSLLAGLVRAAAAFLALFGLLSASPALAQDIPGNKSTGATLAKGTLRTSAINFSGDADWFKVGLTTPTATESPPQARP